ncbi:archaeosortase A [Methanoregula sp.]|jgi:archaeosortase A (PGF-CTERM-specific)|uniref:archaeosortase A n=1 Tax=Methanoregula sp. TaxID=2052170 RepID=UPI003D0A1F23
MMIEYLVLISCIGFLAFLIPGRHRKYAAITGWVFIVLFLFAGLPEYFSENNFLYPVMAVLSVPFLYITTKYLLADDIRVLHLSRAAAVAFLIYAPFEYLPVAGGWLISMVVSQVVWLLQFFNYPVSLDAWNIIAQHGFRVEIILACTGIQSIAIMLGVAAAVPTTLRQKLYAFLLVAPTIYILNLLRNVFVIIAYTSQWFPYYPDIAGNGEIGYESFFWAHNVIAEMLALVVLILIAYGLFTFIPRLGTFADELYQLYYGEIIKGFRRGKGNGPDKPDWSSETVNGSEPAPADMPDEPGKQ